VRELIASIGSHIARHRGQPKPFLWTAKASGNSGEIQARQSGGE